MSYDSPKYNALSQMFHWLSVFFVILLLILGYGRSFIPGEWRDFAIILHMNIGVILFILTLIRLTWRIKCAPPELPKTTLPHEKLGANIVHISLYFILIAIPVSGILMAQYMGKVLPIAGYLNIPLLVEKNRAIAIFIKNWHENLAILLTILVCLHIGAALFHQFIRKDNLLDRMLPFQKK